MSIENENVVEDKETVQSIAREIIEPGLRKILAEARKKGSAEEVVTALANTYVGILVDVLGRDAASSFLQGHAAHITSLKEQPISN